MKSHQKWLAGSNEAKKEKELSETTGKKNGESGKQLRFLLSLKDSDRKPPSSLGEG